MKIQVNPILVKYIKENGVDFVSYMRAVLAKRDQIENFDVQVVDGEPSTLIVIPECGPELNFGSFDLGKEIIDNFFEFNRIRSAAFYNLLPNIGYSKFFPVEKTASKFCVARAEGLLYKNEDRWVMISKLVELVEQVLEQINCEEI